MLAFHGFETFIKMGGYGNYVWTAFAISFALLFFNYLFIRSHFRRSKKALKKRIERMADENST